MACMDCYECPYHIDNGGKCEEMYYDCPYDVYIQYAKKVQENKLPEDFSIKELLTKYENMKKAVTEFTDYLYEIGVIDDRINNAEMRIDDTEDVYNEFTYEKFKDILGIKGSD